MIKRFYYWLIKKLILGPVREILEKENVITLDEKLKIGKLFVAREKPIEDEYFRKW